MNVPTPPRAFRWDLHRALAVAALALGVLALAGRPVRGHVVTIDTQELATIVASEVDHVTAPDLADMIIRGATDYRLIDLRAATAYDAYHIPTAENIPLAGLPDAGLGRNEKLILYSDGGIHAAQAWMLLCAQGYRGVTTLRGGLDLWKDEVLYPVAPRDPSREDAARFARAVEVARSFGGQPRAAAADSGGAAMSALPVPALPKAPPPSARKSAGPAPKKKDGC